MAWVRRADGKAVGIGPKGIRGIAVRLRVEQGFALPTVYFTLLAAFAIVTVGVIATANTQHGTIRDQQTKAALQLAETGVNEAVLHYNRLIPSPTNRCSPVTSSPPDANGWCQVASQQFNAGTFRYFVKVPAVDAQGRFVTGTDGNVTLRVVGVGTMGATTRRVLVDVKSLGTQPFPDDYVVKSAGDITLNGNAEIHAGTATNGGISIASNAKVCGPLSVGVGRAVTGSGSYYNDGACTQPSTSYQQQNLSLPPLGAVPTLSNNNFLFGTDVVSAGNKSKACFDGRDGNNAPSTACFNRRLELQQNTSVSLTGTVYVVCKLTMSSNTSLTVPSGQSVEIWFDSPERCADSRDPTCLPNTTAPCVQLDMSSNSRITSNGGSQSDVRLLFLGSPTRRSTVNLASNTDANAACQQNMIIYAPLSDVFIKGGNTQGTATYCGALAARTVSLDSNVVLTAGKHDLTLQSTYPYYRAAQFIECNAAPASAPDYAAGC